MVNVINTPQKPAAKTPPCEPACPPVCPDCGGLECLCRPRFFAGQLLTDEDLRRLDHYIVAKNRLHNRYLIGWGVVCGMEVVCNPCDGTVTVKSGYALSKCGDDIVLCGDTVVAVCDLIKKCRPAQTDCRAFQPGVPDPCQDSTGQWTLFVHYDEKPSRSVAPLKPGTCCPSCASGSSCSCGCQGNGSNGNKTSGCGCTGNSKKTSTTASQTGSFAAAQCEPTVVCESARFEVRKYIPPTREELAQDHSALGDRFICCVDALFSLLQQVPTMNQEPDVRTWLCDIRNVLLDFFASHPGYDCTIASQLASLCPPQGAQINVLQAISDAIFVLEEYVQKCLCSILLPPCPGAVDDSAVPLAVITVRSSDCQVQSICNLTARKFAVTMPNLAYWFSPIPAVRNLRRLIEKFCCTPPPRINIRFDNRKAFRANVAFAARTTTPAQDVAEVAAQAWMRRGQSPVDVRQITMNALGLGDESGNPLLSDAEQQHPLAALLFNQLGVPLAENALPPELVRLASAAVGRAVVEPPKGSMDPQTEITHLKDRLDAMKSELVSHETRLNELKKQLKKK